MMRTMARLIEPREYPAVAPAVTARSAASIETAAGEHRKLALHRFGELAGDRQFALALEALDGSTGLGVVDAGRLELAKAVLAERALHGEHLARRRRQRARRRRLGYGHGRLMRRRRARRRRWMVGQELGDRILAGRDGRRRRG